MLYLRADATEGFSGGYHYQTRGILKKLPESPNFKVKLTLEVKQGGGPKSQFYLIDIGSCREKDGSPCDGDVLTDVTRYCEMIINPETPAWCSHNNLNACPPYHMTGTSLTRPTITTALPVTPTTWSRLLTPDSNTQAQEIVPILPHPV